MIKMKEIEKEISIFFGFRLTNILSFYCGNIISNHPELNNFIDELFLIDVPIEF